MFAGYRSPARTPRPHLGVCLSMGIEPKAHTAEFKVRRHSNLLLRQKETLEFISKTKGDT